jgi:hypothetical protein
MFALRESRWVDGGQTVLAPLIGSLRLPRRVGGALRTSRSSEEALWSSEGITALVDSKDARHKLATIPPW